MLLKELKSMLLGKVKTFEGKRIFYMNTSDLYNYVSKEDWEKIKYWNRICIYSSKNGKPNKCFYFNFGWGGRPEMIEEITVLKVA